MNNNITKKTQYFLEGTNLLHREDGPAYEVQSSGSWVKEYFLNGKPHRVDGPACEFIEGSVHYKAYALNGKDLRIGDKLIQDDETFFAYLKHIRRE
jgi:hypothetical protein